jgi:vitamin K-dependent gamma-carboxylase
MASSKKTNRLRPIAKPGVPSNSAGWLATCQNRSYEPVDVAGLVFFRIAFGLLLLVEICRFLLWDWVHSDFVAPPFHFTYYGFAGVKPLPAVLMHALFWGLAACALLIAIGWRYRLACALFFAGFTYVFLLERSLYLNHFYLIALICFLMIFVPANRRFSVDSWLNPQLASDYVPAGSLWLLRFQIAVPYVYGGIAKLNGDWIYGQPMQMWMSRMRHIVAVVPWFDEPWLALTFSYGGLLIDLFVVPLLLWKRTRAIALTVAVCFHLLNALMFEIGVFPWFMICATTLFLDPDWPRRLLARFSPKLQTALQPRLPQPATSPTRPMLHQLALAGLGLYVAFQLLFPLRHFAYPGHVDWTEEGSQFAWRMMLNDKTAAIQFVGVEPNSGQPTPIDIRPYLTARQLTKMSHDPSMIRDFAVFLGDRLQEKSGERAEVHAIAFCTLNGRKPQLLVDPTVDLGRTERQLSPQAWIVPLHEPLRAVAWEIPPHQWQGEITMPSIEASGR